MPAAIPPRLLAASLLIALPAAAQADVVLSSNDGHSVMDANMTIVAANPPAPDTISLIEVGSYPRSSRQPSRCRAASSGRRWPLDRQGRKLGDRNLGDQGRCSGEDRHRPGRPGQRDRPHQQSAEDRAKPDLRPRRHRSTGFAQRGPGIDRQPDRGHRLDLHGQGQAADRGRQGRHRQQGIAAERRRYSSTIRPRC